MYFFFKDSWTFLKDSWIFTKPREGCGTEGAFASPFPTSLEVEESLCLSHLCLAEDAQQRGILQYPHTYSCSPFAFNLRKYCCIIHVCSTEHPPGG